MVVTQAVATDWERTQPKTHTYTCIYAYAYNILIHAFKLFMLPQARFTHTYVHKQNSSHNTAYARVSDGMQSNISVYRSHTALRLSMCCGLRLRIYISRTPLLSLQAGCTCLRGKRDKKKDTKKHRQAESAKTRANSTLYFCFSWRAIVYLSSCLAIVCLPLPKHPPYPAEEVE